MSIARQTAGELAAKITDIVGERGNNYGPPEENFSNIANLWRAWIKARHGVWLELDAADVGHMSALIKVARLAQTPTHQDSALDGAIYMMLGHGCSVDASQRSLGEDQATFSGWKNIHADKISVGTITSEPPMAPGYTPALSVAAPTDESGLSTGFSFVPPLPQQTGTAVPVTTPGWACACCAHNVPVLEGCKLCDDERAERAAALVARTK